MTIDLEMPGRRPRFRRAAAAPPFRLTDGDVEIIRQLARHRFLRSTHVAALVGRSLDRANNRLCRLFHAGYIDRPRAQLDYYPTAGSAPMVYALADGGARLLAEHGGAFANPEASFPGHVGHAILLAPGNYGNLSLTNQSFRVFPSEVTIKSADPANPGVFSGLQLNGVTHLTFDAVVFDYVSGAGTPTCVRAIHYPRS